MLHFGTPTIQLLQKEEKTNSEVLLFCLPLHSLMVAPLSPLPGNYLQKLHLHPTSTVTFPPLSYVIRGGVSKAQVPRYLCEQVKRQVGSVSAVPCRVKCWLAGFRRPLHLYVKGAPEGSHGAEAHDQAACSRDGLTTSTKAMP